ncbi:hypothetical protein [Bosea sp. PAMC 26642]|uniref:hypothetical protein n=1 Tax=Bosea sp. (strain PAMC 26642) TaxID=1792307 RepID=UPI001F31FC47|nr:hypothetical protein [Bosea sp. PAMC 26642]
MADNDVALMVEVAEETTCVRHHKQKIAMPYRTLDRMAPLHRETIRREAVALLEQMDQPASHSPLRSQGDLLGWADQWRLPSSSARQGSKLRRNMRPSWPTWPVSQTSGTHLRLPCPVLVPEHRFADAMPDKRGYSGLTGYSNPRANAGHGDG